MYMHKHIHRHRQKTQTDNHRKKSDIQPDRQANGHTDRQPVRQAGKPTDRHRSRNRHRHTQRNDEFVLGGKRQYRCEAIYSQSLKSNEPGFQKHT